MTETDRDRALELPYSCIFWGTAIIDGNGLLVIDYFLLFKLKKKCRFFLFNSLTLIILGSIIR